MELEQRVLMLPVGSISPNPAQPRQVFDPAALEALASSIRENGILQPLTVRRRGGEDLWELVAGERRLRAAKLAGLTHVPCLEWAANDAGSALLALVENLQREDLHYFEEAEAISAFVQKTGMTQEAAAKKLGLSPSALANKLRLLRLSPECRRILTEGGLTERHARALLRLESEDERLAAVKHSAAAGLNVAQTEQYVRRRVESLQHAPSKGRRAYIIKDVRLFLNSVDHGLQIIQSAGIDAVSQREETDEAIILTIRIPRDIHVKAPSLLQDCNVIPPKTCYTDVC
jgi:ParB family chromosome partitioning protein